jgi:AraC-like DNA-binding protein
MTVKHLHACDALANHVEKILVIEDLRVAGTFSLPLFANGSPALVFKTRKGTLSNNTTSHLMLFGQTIVPQAIHFTEDFTLIAYFFRPYSIESIFRVSAFELTDNPVDYDLLASTKAFQLREQLLNAESTDMMLALLNNYILKLISGPIISSPGIEYAAAVLAHRHSKEALLSVQKELHVTERTFQRMFEKHIGVAPNLYRRIRQFDAAFQQLGNKRFQKLSDIAFENGYADQSHFIRAFKEFTTLTPRQYLGFQLGPQS